MPRKKRDPLVNKYGMQRLCIFPHCCAWADHMHHITYKPPTLAPLCAPHHKDITAVNINMWEEYGHKLKYAERMLAWGKWLMGEIQPKYTARVEEWLSTWDEYEKKKAAELAESTSV